MIKIVVFFLLFYSFNSLGQQQKIIEEYLNKSTNVEELIFLIDILNKEEIDYTFYTNSIPNINPLNPKKKQKISRTFSNKKVFHPIDKTQKPHYGIDIAANLGTFIYAPANGVVIKSVNSNYGYGNQIFIKHKYGYQTRFAHLYINLVKKNDIIKKGDIIGLVGSTGKSTGNHLHYEVIKNGKHLDPLPFMNLFL